MIILVGLLLMVLGFIVYIIFDMLDDVYTRYDKNINLTVWRRYPWAIPLIRVLLFGGSTVTSIGIIYYLYNWIVQ
jgi:hypothetical protein